LRLKPLPASATTGSGFVALKSEVIDAKSSSLLQGVIPAKAGIHFDVAQAPWIPAFAGMTSRLRAAFDLHERRRATTP